MNYKTAPFIHSVYFWLKEPDNHNDRLAFEQSLMDFIDQSVYIKTKHLGIPATTNREVIDRSYTYNLVLSFSNMEDQNAYQEEPNHKTFIHESADLWKKVIVYDSESII